MCLNFFVFFFVVIFYIILVYIVFDILENIDFFFCKIDNFSDVVDRIFYVQVFVVCLCIVFFIFFIGVLVFYFGLYMVLVGSFIGMCLVFIFLVIFYMKICYDRLQWYDFVIDILVVLFGFVGVIIGCYFFVFVFIVEYQKYEF